MSVVNRKAAFPPPQRPPGRDARRRPTSVASNAASGGRYACWPRGRRRGRVAGAARVVRRRPRSILGSSRSTAWDWIRATTASSSPRTPGCLACARKDSDARVADCYQDTLASRVVAPDRSLAGSHPNLRDWQFRRRGRPLLGLVKTTGAGVADDGGSRRTERRRVDAMVFTNGSPTPPSSPRAATAPTVPACGRDRSDRSEGPQE